MTEREENNENQEWYTSTTSFDSLQTWRETVTKADSVIGSRIETLKDQLPASSEKALWEMLAPDMDVSWAQVQSELKTAERQLHVLQTDEKPLGAIGMALEGERVKTAENDYNNALAGFVLLDENLRQQQDVRETLDGLVVQVRERLHLIEQMEKTSKDLRAIHAQLDEFLSAPPAPSAELCLPDIDMVFIAETATDETLIEQARTLARSGKDALGKLPEPTKAPLADPSLSSLFGTFARKSIASLKRTYTSAASKQPKSTL